MKETKRRALSRGLWRLLDDKIGSERIIKMRREVVNLSNMVNEYVDKRRTQSRITVGSQAEGLMMKGTDNDAINVCRF
ncbi:hypothetical protein FSP39_005748 [Pinctada imbricata]|uniref:Uncharacterized protein n=1 Tax=Pinctada imbricata TaxID=66713 RepID=A0AA88XP93_PINIB|nr:hypothetical protein FSP39_005748 [Pinctada imbricata]